MIRFALLGLGTGAIYALISHGLILVYRGSGILNFAHGAFAAVGAFAYFELHDQAGLPQLLAIALAVGLCALLGALVHLVVMRALATAPPLTRVIATLGLMAVIVQAGSIRYGGGIRIAPAILPNNPVTLVGDATVGADRYILVGIAVAISTALWLFYRYSNFGIATSAVAENPTIAQITGRSPDAIAALNWAIGSGLAGLAGVLIAPLIPFTAPNLVLLIIPALAAGLAASFASFPIALFAALAMGVAQSLMARYVGTPGWSASVPFLAVILILVIRGRALPLRSHVNQALPDIGSVVIRGPVVAVLAALAGIVVFAAPTSWSDAFIVTITGAIVCLSLVVVTGYAGQLSLAQFAFAGFAGWVSARLAAVYGLPFPLVLVIGVLAAAPAGVLVGLPALRTRGINLAVVTFGLAFAVQNILFQNIAYTGGQRGTTVAPPTVFGLEIDALNHPKRYAAACLALLVLAALVVKNVRRGRSGRRLIAVRSNERAAAAMGISVVGAKLYAFALSAAIAGVGGVMLAFRNPNVQFSQFDVFQSVNVVIFTVIGGVGFVAGAIIGGFSFSGGLVSRIVGALVDGGNVRAWVTLVLAAVLIPTLIAYPNGIASYLAAQRARLGIVRDGEPGGSDDARAAPIGEREPITAPTVITAPKVAPRTLTVEELRVTFGGIVALDGVSLEVRPGEVLGVMGPNGAGKTTLIDAITGFVPLSRGHVSIDDLSIERLSARRRAQLGLGRSFQSLELFEEVSVLDNLATACDLRDARSYFTDLVRPSRPVLSERTEAAIEVLQLDDDLHRRPRDLSYGKRRLVAIARAIAGDPSILLLDEPAAGLDETETAELGRLISELAGSWGFSVMLIEHDVPMLMSVSTRIVALDFGQVIAHGTPSEIRGDEHVIASYLGEVHDGGETAAEARVPDSAELGGGT